MTLTLDLTADFSVVDNLETVTVTRLDKEHEDVESSFFTPIKTREITASNGRYTAGDVRCHLPIVNTTMKPVVGGTITTTGGDVYVILDVDNAGMSGIYKCGARRLSIYDELDTYVSIQRATWAKDAFGVQSATWATEHANVRARIQPATQVIEQDENARRAKKRFSVSFSTDQVLDHDRRLIGADGAIYKILSYSNRERLDVLPTALVELL